MVIDDGEVTNVLMTLSQTCPCYQIFETGLRKSVPSAMVGGGMDHIVEPTFWPLGLGRGKIEDKVSFRSSPRACLA